MGELANQRKTEFVQTFLKAAENVEMTDEDAGIGENHGTEFKHDSLMDYSNIQLDFIKVFGERFFVMVISKLYLCLLCSKVCEGDTFSCVEYASEIIKINFQGVTATPFPISGHSSITCSK